MLRDHSRELDLSLQAVDLLLGAAVFVGMLSLVGSPALAGERSLLPLGLASSLAWPVLLRSFDLYRSQRRQSLLSLLRQLVFVSVFAVLIESTAAFLTRAPVPRWFPLLCVLTQLMGIASLRVLVHGALRSLRSSGHNIRNVLIAGSGPRAAYVNEVIDRLWIRIRLNGHSGQAIIFIRTALPLIQVL